MSIAITPVQVYNPKSGVLTPVSVPHPWNINPSYVVSVEDRSLIVGSPAFVIHMEDGYEFIVTVDPGV